MGRELDKLVDIYENVLISENFKNFIGPSSKNDRLRYVDQVWDILQLSYKKIGGIKGTGFNDKEDMVNTIPFWKIYTQNGNVIVVVMYKDSEGRKAVAYGTDGSDKAKQILAGIFKAELGISWGEKSKGALVFLSRALPFNVYEPYLMTPYEVEQTLSDKKIIIPNSTYVDENLDKEDTAVYYRLKMFAPYFYVREIGGEPHLKVAMGTLDHTITY